MRHFLFVGEKPSERALQMGVRWEDGRLAAKTLFDALLAIGINPARQRYYNWFEQPLEHRAVAHVKRHLRQGQTVVALGNKVSQAMEKCFLPHVKMVHPAARGSIRRRERYHAHVKEVLNAIAAMP